MSIKTLEQRQQTIEQGLAQLKNKEQADIDGMANAFLSSSDPIGFIGRLASEAPTKIAPVVNAARRKKNESMQAQVPQQETVTTAGIREVLTPQPQPDPRQAAIASLPMNPNMYSKGMAGGGIVAFQNKGFVDLLKERAARNPLDAMSENQIASTFMKSSLQDILAAQRGGLASENLLDGKSNIRSVSKRFSPSGKVDFSFEYTDSETGIDGIRIPGAGVGGGEGVDGGAGVGGGAEFGSGEKIAESIARQRGKINEEKPSQRTTIQDIAQDVDFRPEEGGVEEKLVEEIGKKKLLPENITDPEVVPVTVDPAKTEKSGGNVEDGKIIDFSTIADPSLGERAEDILKQRKAVLGEFPEYKRGDLSADDLAYLGLLGGLKLLGTKEQDFLSAVGKAGEPVVKEALVRQKEKGDREYKRALAQRTEKADIVSGLIKEKRDLEKEELNNQAAEVRQIISTKGTITAAQIRAVPEVEKIARLLMEEDPSLTKTEAMKTAAKDILGTKSALQAADKGYLKMRESKALDVFNTQIKNFGSTPNIYNRLMSGTPITKDQFPKDTLVDLGLISKDEDVNNLSLERRKQIQKDASQKLFEYKNNLVNQFVQNSDAI